MTTQVKQHSEEPNFANRLHTAMRAKGIGYGRLSQATGITQRQLVNYRKGKHEPRDHYGKPTPNASLLARALGVDIDWLVPPRMSDDAPDPVAA